MSFRKSRNYKILLGLLTVACLGGAGYLGYKTFFSSRSADKEFKAAEAAYARGLEAYQQKNWKAAAERFDEARLLSDKATEALELQAKENKLTAEEARSLQGRIMWVRALAIRDRAYAKAQDEGKSLPEIPDPQYKEAYRAFVVIPNPEDLVAARDSLRLAANNLSADPELGKSVLKEMLRLELAITQIDWRFTAPLLRKALALDPKDARSNYYLARFEYEQPADNGGPSPYDRRDSSRVEEARKYLTAAKQSGAPFWRTAGLEAEVAEWPLRTAATRKLKPEAVKAAELAVDELLFDARNGLVLVAARGENFDNLGPADTKGLVSVMTVGLERAISDARRTGGNHDRLRLVARTVLDVANRLVDDPALKGQASEFGPTVAVVAVNAQPYLAAADPAAWRDFAAGVTALRAKAPDVIDRSAPALLQLARVAGVDGDRALRAGEPAEKVKAFRDQALKDAEAGLKAAEAARLPGAQVDELHLYLAELKLQAGAKGDEVEPHLARLRLSPVPRFKLIGQFYDARVAERRGRLETARKLLQGVLADRTPEGRDVVFQAQVLLAGIALATNDPLASVAALREVESQYNSADLPASARGWADQILGGQDTITSALAVANLGVAAQIRAKFRKDNPGRTDLPKEVQEQVDGPEKKAVELVGKLKAPTVADGTARMAVVTYLASTGRRKDAESWLERLALDYPESIGVLRTRCLLLAAPTEPNTPLNPNGVAAADLLVTKYLKDYPNSLGGKLFRAEWLMTTNRADEAVKYLSDKETFGTERPPAVERVLATALLRTGRREEAQKILSKLPADQGLTVTMIRALTPELGEKLKASLNRYEDQGMYRITDAAIKLTENKYEESARGFASALEFTRVKESARSGMQLALVAYAENDPAKGRDTAVRFAADHPDEPGVYLAAALAALFLEDVGNPGDRWDTVKTMYAAVNEWEKVAAKTGAKPADLAVSKALFHLLAGAPDLARREAVTNLNRNQDHLQTILMLVELNLAPPADTARAREYLAMARKANPDDPRLPYLTATIHATEGDWAGAAKVYEGMLEKAPNKAAIYPLLVGATEQAGDKAAALKWAETWAKEDPKNGGAAVEVIRLTTLAGKKDEAIKLADRWVADREAEVRDRAKNTFPPTPAEDLEKNVKNARAAAQLSLAATFSRAKEYELADARIAEVVKTLPEAEKSDALRLLNGDIAIFRKQWDKALAVYRAMLEDNPRHFIAGNNAAWILAEKMDKPAEALTLVETVRKGRGGVPIGPERLPADFLDTIGTVYLKLNPPRYAEMKTVFEAARRRYPADPRMLLFLGHALAGTGDATRAAETFDAAVRLAKTKNGLSDEKNKTAIEAAEAAKKKLGK